MSLQTQERAKSIHDFIDTIDEETLHEHLDLDGIGLDTFEGYYVCYGSIRNEGAIQIIEWVKKKGADGLFDDTQFIIEYEDCEKEWAVLTDMTTGEEKPLYNFSGDYHPDADKVYPIEFLDKLQDYTWERS